MNDKELADRVVALGVGKKQGRSYSVRSNQLPDDPVPVWTLRTSAGFVRDWRVAGALMEKCGEEKELWLNVFKDAHDQHRCAIDEMIGAENEEIVDEASDSSLSRVIIRACVKALETVRQGPKQ